jgi:hypothetical protein
MTIILKYVAPVMEDNFLRISVVIIVNIFIRPFLIHYYCTIMINAASMDNLWSENNKYFCTY